MPGATFHYFDSRVNTIEIFALEHTALGIQRAMLYLQCTARHAPTKSGKAHRNRSRKAGQYRKRASRVTDGISDTSSDNDAQGFVGNELR
jgi:hypothetical protein